MKTPEKHVFRCIDAHTCGNPVRLIYEGVPELEGQSMLDKQQDFIRHHDWIRKALMFEPRGHAMMSGSILCASNRADCDIGVIFVETSGCLPMCGHGTIGTATIAIEHELVSPRQAGKLNLETPAGRVEVSYTMEGDKVRSVRLINVPSFVHSTDLTVNCPELGGDLRFAVAYGGNFYAIIEPQEHYDDLSALSAADILRLSPIVRERIRQKYAFEHPDDSRLSKLRHLMWTGKPLEKGSDGRNAVFYGSAAIDRSPCGTGTSSRMALLAHRGELAVGEPYVQESYIGTRFNCSIVAETSVGAYPAVIPAIEGWARIYGHNVISVDPADDPLWVGFVVT